ncbi:MAG TPA: class I SAM-dependent methyltransferase [Solirubrobacteraceae bacterium]|nr:class I SAM-dependent methyltransferase [Solirubrobacteraceae bacterium]
MPREWDADTYADLPLPHVAWGLWVHEHLPLEGDERVMDAGCGTGRETVRLLDRLPRGRVVALDGSRNMLEATRAAAGARADRVELVHADLGRPLPLTDPVDAITSVAALHWLPDHAATFAHLHAGLRPGGPFVAEWGGPGNIANVRAAIAGAGGERAADPWNFAGVEETARRLHAAGFEDVEVEAADAPAAFARGAELERYLEAVVLGAHLDAMAPADRRPFVRAVAEALGEPVIDYVRLRARARRAV